MPLRRGVPLGGRDARVRDPHHEVRLHRRLLGQQLAHPAPRPVHLPAVEAGVGAGEVDELEDAEVGVHAVGREELLGAHAPSPSIVTSSPGSSSRTKVAPITSSAGDSEASTQPSGRSAAPRRPRQSGRKPWGSRTP